MKKKTIIWMCVPVIFIITNPSITAFKDYIGGASYRGLHRDLNLFVMSVYDNSDRTYIGAFGNFINITKESKITKVIYPKKNQIDEFSQYEIDSSKMDTAPKIKKEKVKFDEYGIPIRKH